MKLLMLIISIASFSIVGYAAEPLSGYIVLPNNDTVICKVKGGRFLNTPFYGITIINEQGEDERLPSKDKQIIAFGFVENSRLYDFFFINAGSKSDNGFYQRLVNGRKYKLYSRPIQIAGDGPGYILFNPAGDFVKFETCIICPWKKRLRELLKDDPKALELVEDAPRINIPKFVVDINKVN